MNEQVREAMWIHHAETMDDKEFPQWCHNLAKDLKPEDIEESASVLHELLLI